MFSFRAPSSMRAHTRSNNAMAASSFLFLAILAAAATTTSSNVDGRSNGSCLPTERAALLSFKADITVDPANRLASWQQGHHDCCLWSGVTCSRRTGHVIKLDLRNDYPVLEEDYYLGPGDTENHSLRGQVSSSLLALRHLMHLDLSWNIFLGDAKAMPGFLGSLRSLRYLNLSNMGFHGRVPPQLGNLSKLVQLDMHANYDTDLHTNDISWLASLGFLEHLNMGGINLSGVIDWVHKVNALPNLVVLAMFSCGLIKSNVSWSLVHQKLTVLEELDLSYNPFQGPSASNWFWDVTSLKRLHLRGCELSGTFPDELGNLTLLETFDVQGNNIQGMIPTTLKNMCNLRSLDLSFNNIGGGITEVIDRIPSCARKNLQELSLMDANITGTTLQFVTNLTSLYVLNVHGNQLSGSVPMEIGTLANLTYLNLGNNTLSGSVPAEIGTLTSLTHLYLGVGRNNLSGAISEDHFAGLMNLESLDLSYNNFDVIVDSHWIPPFNLESAWFSSCHLGPQFPKWLRWQKSTKILHISNTGLVGKIPYWFWTTFSDATYLDISLNHLSGNLPLNLEFMSVIKLLMQSNLLTGLIPKLSRTTEILDISRNSLNGFVPNFQAPQLRAAVLFSNSITGTIPKTICRMQKLRVLDLSNNLLSKELPDCGIKELKQGNPSSSNSSKVRSLRYFSLRITSFLLSNNSFSSGFPLFLRQCPRLVFLDLTQNKFTGELPGWISEAMPGLVMLRLRSNKFSGHIPVEIMGLQDVCILDLSNNNFSGAIPKYLEKLKALTHTSTSNNISFDNPFDEGYHSSMSMSSSLSNDSFLVVIKGHLLEYRENTRYLMSIDLSCNSLMGEIPEDLTSLVGLINLNLSSNLLSGNIPYKIGNLRSLESLDLSKNRLAGEIPEGLSDLTYLSCLNLSYNNLSGRIPSGHQLDIIETNDPASMYIGNPGLCGLPVSRQCPRPPRDPPSNGDSARWFEYGLSQMDFLIGLIVGFVVGAWMVFCGLLFMKRWRYTYFGVLDKLYDRLYVISVVTLQKRFGNTG
ncbi:hypothetical protein ACQJBY_041703 [Aegilops geniculata]